ncbi:MAG: Gfo/Idh/MocA family oxidoreductase, partial [candidate division NC10 bacterium]|nr:Gfo/Idh/MocA family oxidoreductase [candidate division NC10 bacterium]
MARVKLGLIGMGLIGRAHAKTLQAVGECELAAISDINECYRDDAAALGVPYYQDYKEMIERQHLHAVIVATPNHLHVPIGIACAVRGLHLLVEKP